MPASGATPDRIRPVSIRRRVDRQILLFSTSIGMAGALLIAMMYGVSSYPFVMHWHAVNLHALSQIACSGRTCDTTTYSTDWQ